MEAVVIVLCLVLIVGLCGKIVQLRTGICGLNRLLDAGLDSVKFGPEGEESRRKTAERIGRIR